MIKKSEFIFCVLKSFYYLCAPIAKDAIEKPIGQLAEWLGSGLQNHVRRFDSATDLETRLKFRRVFCFTKQ